MLRSEQMALPIPITDNTPRGPAANEVTPLQMRFDAVRGKLKRRSDSDKRWTRKRLGSSFCRS
jgi:hypothetical protein